VPPERIGQLFEPFSTTDAKGTGLGLYIAREICAGNDSVLEYIPMALGACFRITFPAKT
jgi:two-component system sensor histidine kinase PilS (NtrC family)